MNRMIGFEHKPTAAERQIADWLIRNDIVWDLEVMADGMDAEIKRVVRLYHATIAAEHAMALRMNARHGMQVGDIVTVTPKGLRYFRVVALDDLYSSFVRVEPADDDEEGGARWVSLTYVAIVSKAQPVA